MEKNGDLLALHAKKISRVDTQLGYMQLLEYTLQDFSYLHVLQWHFNNVTEIDENTLIPKINALTFYRDKDSALKKAHEIGNNLLQTYLI